MCQDILDWIHIGFSYWFSVVCFVCPHIYMYTYIHNLISKTKHNINMFVSFRLDSLRMKCDNIYYINFRLDSLSKGIQAGQPFFCDCKRINKLEPQKYLNIFYWMFGLNYAHSLFLFNMIISHMKMFVWNCLWWKTWSCKFYKHEKAA